MFQDDKKTSFTSFGSGGQGGVINRGYDDSDLGDDMSDFSSVRGSAGRASVQFQELDNLAHTQV